MPAFRKLSAKIKAACQAFIKALGLTKVDVLGFSLGGLVAQALTVAEPNLVRHLILVGTGPRSGKGMATLTPEAQAVFGATYANPDELWLGVFFTPTEARQAAGRAFLKRFRVRAADRDPEVSDKVAPTQIEWTYEDPYAAVMPIKDHLAFYPDRVDAIEERRGG